MTACCTALLVGRMAQSWRKELEELSRDKINFLDWPLQGDFAVGRVTATAIVSPRYDASFGTISGLKLLQSPLAGLDLIDFEAVDPGVFVCNAGGHENSVAEYVAAATLASSRSLFKAAASFSSGSWDYSSRTDGPAGEDALGKTLLVVGYGLIGRAIAHKAHALGMRVSACNRSAVHDRIVNNYYPIHHLKEAMRRADFIVIALGLTDETRGIIDADILSALNSRTTLINVARGECIEERDLFEFCKNNPAANVFIDTWYRYPTDGDPSPSPSLFDFSALPNVVMTPHIAAWTENVIRIRQSSIVANIMRVNESKLPHNLVYIKQ